LNWFGNEFLKIVFAVLPRTCYYLHVMKNLTINYKAKVQVLDGGNADELLESIILEAVDPRVDIVEYFLDESNIVVDSENPDFFKVDTRFKVTVEAEGEIEDLAENGIEFDVEGLFIVWDWEVYGWGEESVR
jgi:hypothetical protein